MGFLSPPNKNPGNSINRPIHPYATGTLKIILPQDIGGKTPVNYQQKDIFKNAFPKSKNKL